MKEPTAREAILTAVRSARPPSVPLPGPRAQVPRDEAWAGDLVAEFTHTATAAGAAVQGCESSEAGRVARELSAGAPRVWSLISGVETTVRPAEDPRSASVLDLFVCEAELGVAENGALWLATNDAHRRAALFLASRVIIVVAADAIVPDLHDAYARLDVAATTYGVFVAGPSKTADIEQSLVIGAHGPKELTVLVVSGVPGAMRPTAR